MQVKSIGLHLFLYNVLNKLTLIGNIKEKCVFCNYADLNFGQKNETNVNSKSRSYSVVIVQYMNVKRGIEMKNLKINTLKSVILSFFVLCLLTTIACAQESDVLQLYNRDEKVQLSKPLIHKNDDYYIFADDLSKINIKYKFEENADGFKFYLFSQDAFGTENTLRIDASEEDLYRWDESVGGMVSLSSYNFSNVMTSKKSAVLNNTGMQINSLNIGDFQSVIIEDGDYYISLKAISAAISYEYSVNDNMIKLWVTNSSHYVVNGEISLPEGEIASENGVDVKVLVSNGDGNLTDNCTFKKVCIPQGTDKTYYFIETDIVDSSYWMMYEFDGNYKTVNEFINAKSGSKLDITTVQTEKIPFDINVSMPHGLEAADDIYASVIFKWCSMYKNDEPIIKKGEKSGNVTINIDKSFAGKVAFAEISGDDRIFDYGYYGYGDLRLLEENARIVSAANGRISTEFIGSRRISGKVIPEEETDGYKVRIFGHTDSQEKIYLSQAVGEDYNFSIKVPETIPEYTLSVAYKPGAYCGYVSDGVSSYSRKYHIFENVCDYMNIQLKYEPFLPDLPIDMKAYANTCWVEVKNISDANTGKFTLYCAHYRDGRLIDLRSIPIDNLEPYSDDYTSYSFEKPKEFYKTEDMKIFAWSGNIKPFSASITKKVNEPYYPDDTEFTDVDLKSEYYEAIKSVYLCGVMLGYEDGRFCPGGYIMRSEAAAMFCRLLGYWDGGYEFSCDDVSKTDWESSYVGICVNEKIFDLEDNKFRPDENITVAETCEVLKNILGGQNVSAELFININMENQGRDITRAEFAQMLYNYKNYVNK